ncbi:hypothetical protein ACFL1Z_06400 [Thermodesulfobacteriota bacterium]
MHIKIREGLNELRWDNDLEQRAYRRYYRGYNLTEMQGKGRRERAENWYYQIMDFANRGGWSFNLNFEVIPKTAHRINDRIMDFAGNYLAENGA